MQYPEDFVFLERVDQFFVAAPTAGGEEIRAVLFGEAFGILPGRAQERPQAGAIVDVPVANRGKGFFRRVAVAVKRWRCHFISSLLGD